MQKMEEEYDDIRNEQDRIKWVIAQLEKNNPTVAEMFSLYGKGLSYQVIGEQVGYSGRRVSELMREALRKLGLDIDGRELWEILDVPYRKGPKVDPSSIYQMVYEEGMSIAQTAEALGYSISRIRYLLKRARDSQAAGNYPEYKMRYKKIDGDRLASQHPLFKDYAGLSVREVIDLTDSTYPLHDLAEQHSPNHVWLYMVLRYGFSTEEAAEILDIGISTAKRYVTEMKRFFLENFNRVGFRLTRIRKKHLQKPTQPSSWVEIDDRFRLEDFDALVFEILQRAEGEYSMRQVAAIIKEETGLSPVSHHRVKNSVKKMLRAFGLDDQESPTSLFRQPDALSINERKGYRIILDMHDKGQDINTAQISKAADWTYEVTRSVLTGIWQKLLSEAETDMPRVEEWDMNLLRSVDLNLIHKPAQIQLPARLDRGK